MEAHVEKVHLKKQSLMAVVVALFDSMVKNKVKAPARRSISPLACEWYRNAVVQDQSQNDIFIT